MRYGRDLRDLAPALRFPAVGNFVVLHNQPGASTIVDILPRKTMFTRGASGGGGTNQVIAANIDTVFIVTKRCPVLRVAEQGRTQLLT